MNVITGDKANELKNSSTAPASSVEPEPSHKLPTLPDKPLVVIEAKKGFVNLGLRELWAYRELLYFMIWRDVKIRYKQTMLGVTWAIIQPLFTMLIFTIFFGRLAGIPSDNLPYPIFAYAGLMPWTFFTNAVTASGNSLVGSSNLITKVYFPRMIIPAASVGAGLVDFAVAFLVFIPMMLYFGISPTWQLLMLVPLLFIATMLALGVGMWMSALNVKYRDIRYALPFLMQLWMFVSPIIYPASLLKNWRWVLAINPLTGIIEGFRSALLGKPFGWSSIAVSTVITVATLMFAIYSFRRMEKRFADIV